MTAGYHNDAYDGDAPVKVSMDLLKVNELLMQCVDGWRSGAVATDARSHAINTNQPIHYLLVSHLEFVSCLIFTLVGGLSWFSASDRFYIYI